MGWAWTNSLVDFSSSNFEQFHWPPQQLYPTGTSWTALEYHRHVTESKLCSAKANGKKCLFLLEWPMSQRHVIISNGSRCLTGKYRRFDYYQGHLHLSVPSILFPNCTVFSKTTDTEDHGSVCTMLYSQVWQHLPRPKAPCCNQGKGGTGPEYPVAVRVEAWPVGLAAPNHMGAGPSVLYKFRRYLLWLSAC